MIALECNGVKFSIASVELLVLVSFNDTVKSPILG